MFTYTQLSRTYLDNIDTGITQCIGFSSDIFQKISIMKIFINIFDIRLTSVAE